MTTLLVLERFIFDVYNSVNNRWLVIYVQPTLLSHFSTMGSIFTRGLEYDGVDFQPKYSPFVRSLISFIYY